jgi:hypothetical protein
MNGESSAFAFVAAGFLFGRIILAKNILEIGGFPFVY